jgi:hypothetical protein
MGYLRRKNNANEAWKNEMGIVIGEANRLIL